MLQAFQVYPDAFVSTLGWHLGEQPQNLSMLSGYNQQVEDQLLASFDWQQDGYQLFNHACLALSCQEGWFSSIAESNCLLCPSVGSSGSEVLIVASSAPEGGLVNLDFFSGCGR